MAEASQHHTRVHPAKARYYQVHLDRDLFGDWTLRKVWGGIGSSRGRMHNTGVPSYDEGVEQIREIAKRRGQRGYECVSRPPRHQSGSHSP
jgi:cytochrome b